MPMTDLDIRLERVLAERYAIEREVGRGGMAIVYLARDLRHRRHVALKVLAPDLAHVLGPDRFLREIEIAARLIHPHILPLFDSGAADGLLFYAMPFVEGESLRQRLDRESQLPVDDALEIARQVAGALTFAHSQGIVHRDIKPENILLSGGEALVADFGIARAVTAAGGSRLTQSGMSLGTPAYMSPEQASGEHEVDARSDQYSLACVAYEMLAGEPPFSGQSAQVITARKLSHQEASVSLLRDSVPESVAEAIRKALAPVPADRYGTIGRFAEALRPTGSTALRVDRPPAARRLRRWGGEPLLWLALGAALALLATFAGKTWTDGRSAPRSSVVRMAVTLPPGVNVTRGPGYNAPSVALSPDGRTLVIAATGADGQRLYQRPLDRLAVTPLAGTEGASSPFFSPDGAWLGFFADGRIQRMPAAGGAAVDIARIEEYLAGASWGPDDQIVFASGFNAALSIVSAAGGDVELLIRRDEGEPGHAHPEILPDGRTVLFASGGRIHALDIASGRRAAVVTGMAPRYANGHLIFARGSVLLAAPFDPGRLELTGPSVPLVEGAAHEAGLNVAHYAISRSGALAYLPGTTTQSLVLVNASGDERAVVDELLAFENPRFSPDGARLAVATGRRLGAPTDIWIHDLRTGAGSRLTFDGGRAPVWTPDGASVTFSKLSDRRGIYTTPVDGRGDAEQLLLLNEFHWLVGWTPDGRTLVYGVMEPARGNESLSSIMALTDGTTRRIVGPGSVWGGRLSPDGGWLAYYTLASGRFQIYVIPFPEGRGRWLISEDGGRDPSWGPDGTQLYYRSGDRLMAARLDTSAGVRVLAKRLVLAPFSPPLYDDYHVHPDGQTLAVVRPREESDREIVLVLDWIGDIR